MPTAEAQTPEVQVLLATYNGERFLREQIDSILAQTQPGVAILARDDGSQDGTVTILNEYAQRFPERFRMLSPEAPTGSARSNFLALLQASTAPYVAFADQDDVWLPEKLSLEMHAMRELEQRRGTECPLLVFSDLRVVSESLVPLASSYWKFRDIEPRNIRRLERLLMENVVTGCTAFLNAPLAHKARSMPEEVHMHDWWVALLACTFGDAAFLPQPLVLYRQHAGNVIGALPSERSMRQRLPHDRRHERWSSSVRQASALLRLYRATLSPEASQRLRALLSCDAAASRWRRVGMLLHHGFFIHRFAANLGTAWYLWNKSTADQCKLPE